MDIKITQNASTLWLNGSGVAGAVKAARFSDGAMVEIELALEGTPAAVVTALDQVERLLVEGQRTAGLPGEYPVRVVVTTPEAETWQSPLYGGWTEKVNGPASRKLNGQLVKLHLTRAGWWERSTVTNVTLTNLHGSGASLTVENHNDAAHCNYVTVPAAAVDGDTPAPVILNITKAGLANAEIFTSHGVLCDALNLGHQVEGEAGTEGAGITSTHNADANCSNGNYDALTWNGASLMTAKTYSLSSGFASAAGGRVFRPVCRLRDLVAGGEKYWVNWRTAWDNGSTFELLQDAEGVLLPTDKRLVVFPGMYIPPWPVVDYASDGITLQMMAQAVGAGAHAVALDFVQFMPMDGWLHFIPLATTLADTYLNYDSGRDVLARQTTIMQSHWPEGPGINLYPGRDQRLYFLTSAGNLSDPALALAVSIGFRTRKRAL